MRAVRAFFAALERRESYVATVDLSNDIRYIWLPRAEKITGFGSEISQGLRRGLDELDSAIADARFDR